MVLDRIHTMYTERHAQCFATSRMWNKLKYACERSGNTDSEQCEIFDIFTRTHKKCMPCPFTKLTKKE